MKKKAIITIIIIAAATAAVGGYLYKMHLDKVYQEGVAKYSEHFLPYTRIDGKNVGEKSMAEFLSTVRDRYPEEFTIIENDGTQLTLPLEEVILNHDIEDFVEKCRSMAPEWQDRFEEEIEYTPNSDWEIDEEKLESLVDEALDNKNRKAPKDAYLDEEKFEIVPEEKGNKLYDDKVRESVLEAINEQKLEVELDDSYYLQPKILKDDKSLTDIIAERESYITGKVTVNVAGKVKDSISEKQLEEWLTYDKGTFDFDKDKIADFALDLAEKYNTAYSAREFETSVGTVISVGTGVNDSYAGYILDEEETANSIYDTLKNKEKEVDCVWLLEGYTMDENGDIGGTYIEISIASQHMWVYKDYELAISTDIVSGLESNPNRATPRGLFYLLQMSSPFVMHGDYGTQPCQFFIKVTWDGVAIHDADWQWTFGGDQYIYNGSHGCINTPYDQVAELWDLLEGLDDWQVPVIIYD